VWWKGGWLYRIELGVVEGWLALYGRAQCDGRVAGWLYRTELSVVDGSLAL